eukprot:13595-Heterococcus_DN1.PRE.4
MHAVIISACAASIAGVSTAGCAGPQRAKRCATGCNNTCNTALHAMTPTHTHDHVASTVRDALKHNAQQQCPTKCYSHCCCCC